MAICEREDRALIPTLKALGTEIIRVLAAL
jgi:hypothetical protein